MRTTAGVSAVSLLVAASLGVGWETTRAFPSSQTPAGAAADQAQVSGPGVADEQRPVFRGGATFVRVDVYPRRNGQVVTGLTADDFEVFEDDKPQQVQTFDFIRFDPVAFGDERRDPNTVSDSERQAADPRNRVFVLFLDLFHLSFENVSYVEAPVREFLYRTLAPTDLFAVMTPEIRVSDMTFARQTGSVEAMLPKLWSMVPVGSNPDFPRTPIEERLYGCELIMAYRQHLLYTTLENLVVRLGALKDERKSILFLSEALPLGAAVGGGSRGAGGVPTIGVGRGGRLGIGDHVFDGEDRICEQMAATLRAIDWTDRFRRLLRDAERANVAFYPIDIGGLRTIGVDASGKPRPAGTVDTFKTLAENTGGIAVVNTNGLAEGVHRIADSLSAHYILGYYSSNAAVDGRFREIRVQVKRPGVSVSARRGYYAATPPPEEVASAARPKPSPAIERELSRLARVREDAELFGHVASNANGLIVVTELANRLQSGGRWSSGADVQVRVARGRDQVAAATGHIDTGRSSALIEVPLPAMEPGDAYRVSARISGRDGVIEDDVEFTVPPPSALGGPLMYRVPSSRMPPRPVGDRQYRRNERLRIEWPAQGVVREPAARVLDRNGQPLAMTPAMGERLEGHQRLLTVEFPLSSFAEGEYVLELTASTGADRAESVIAFRVLR